MFEKKTWVNRQSEHPARRRLTPTGSDNEYDIARAEGVVMEDGDAFDADTMNDLERRIGAGFAEYDPTEAGPANVTVQPYTCTKTGKVYALTGSGAVGRCKIPAAWSSGDSFTVNGQAVPAYCGADAVDGDTIVAGRWVTFVFDGTQLNFNGGGGLTASKLALATAPEAYVLEGRKFYAGNKTLRTGTMKDRGQAQYGGVGAGGDYIAINGLPEGYYWSGGQAWAPEARAKMTEFGTAPAWALLEGYNMTSAAGLRVSGGMTNRGNWGAQIAPGGLVTVPPGYHAGGGQVSARKATAAYAHYMNDMGSENTLNYSHTFSGANALVIIVVADRANGDNAINKVNTPTVSSGTVSGPIALNLNVYGDGSRWNNLGKAWIVTNISGDCAVNVTSSAWSWGYGVHVFQIS